MHEWTRYTTAGPTGASRPDDFVELGPDHTDGLDRRLLGEVNGLRVLDLGCGAGRSAVALARQGARVVAIEADQIEVDRVRTAADIAEVHVEVHQGDLAELAFLPADSFDAIVAVHSLAAIENIGRVFRQAHRLLRIDRPIVMTLPHPAALMTDDGSTELVRNYGSDAPLGEGEHLTYPHTIGDVFTQLTRANFRVDTIIESASDTAVPKSVVFRARKTGS